MIVYDLSCKEGHCFEGWFKNSHEFAIQLQAGHLTCPLCGSEHIDKKPSANRLNLGRERSAEKTNVIRRDVDTITQKINAYVQNNFEDVGNLFADKALSMHYGEIEERNIRGIATLDEAIELKEEGVDVFPIPGANKSKLN